MHYHYITCHSLHIHNFYSLRDLNLKFSDRTLLCPGVNSGRFMGLLAFTPPVFSDRVTVQIDIGPCTGHWSQSLLAVNVGFAQASRLRYLRYRPFYVVVLSVDIQMQFSQPHIDEEIVR